MQLHQQKLDQGYDIQAFNVTERSKARTLLELLTESRADIRNGVDPQLLQQERDIQTQLDAIDKRRLELANSRTENKEQIATLETQRANLQTQYRDIQTQIRATSPKYAALKYPQPLTLEQIQQQILDDNTVILTYSLGSDRSYLWLVSKTEMSSYLLPSGQTIEDLVNKKVRPQLTNPRASRTSFIADTTELSNILLKPVLEKIGNKRIVIISDGALQYIPLGALPDPRAENGQYQPLLVNNEVDYLPSASTLQTLRTETQNRTPAPRTLAVLADPVFSTDDRRINQQSPTNTTSATNSNGLPLVAQNLDRAARDARGNWNRLPGTRQEAEALLNLVPESSRLALFDFQANRENALNSQLSQYRFIHWATHGFANAQKPELSGIVMSLVQENGQPQNGYLLLGDIFNLSFNAELMVLSACETGLGEVVKGEGLIGLTRGLMYAGTPRVVTSLWSVPDEQTANLMGKFYTKMLQENLRPAEALRLAQLEMFRSHSWMAPYFWAAFTFQGEWN
jgi:CHAT domain-containing protein